eukprot:427370_1
MTDKPYLLVKFQGEDHIFAPETIQAMLLSKMKQFAEIYLNKQIKYVVLTVPNNFDMRQRKALLDAGTIAGLKIIRMISAPTAAAITYSLHREHKYKNIIVYDLGGGSLDVSVLTLDDGIVEVVSNTADTNLGGQHFDERIMNHFVNVFKRKHKIDFRTNKKAIAKLRREIEGAKLALSSTKQTRIEIENFVEGIDFNEILTRAKFEQFNDDLFRQSLKPLNMALKDAGMKKSEINEIVMVGGSTRIPKIQKLVQEFFDGKTLKRNINPDESAAFGAAMQGAVLSGIIDYDRIVILLDVMPLSLGYEGIGGTMKKVIEKNSAFPTKKTRVVSTHQDGQTVVTIKVFQGERAMTEHNVFLGQFVLNGTIYRNVWNSVWYGILFGWYVPADPRGVPQIEVTFEVDANLLLSVSAMDKTSGYTKTIIIPSSTIATGEMDQMLKIVKQFEEDDKERAKIEQAKAKLESIAYDLINQLDESELNNLSDEDKEIFYDADLDDIIENSMDNDEDWELDTEQQHSDKILPAITQKESEKDDENIRERLNAKNQLEFSMNNIKNQLDVDSKLNKLSIEDRNMLYAAVNNVKHWLDEHLERNVNEYIQKRQELHSIIEQMKLKNHNQQQYSDVHNDIAENSNFDVRYEKQASNGYIDVMGILCTLIAIGCGWFMLKKLIRNGQRLGENVIEYEQKEGEMQNEFKVNEDPPDSKDKQDVKVWLETKVKLPQYYGLFIENGLETLNIIQLLTKQELDEIGIKKIGHRLQILNEIQKLKQKQDDNQTQYI